jgi:hypothetical protein
MTTTASIAELQRAGVILDAGEAVAIAQQLIQALQQSGVGIEPPYGPPTASNVVLNADGSVSCAACGTTPAISEIAIFLDSLIPAGSPRVPGGLRYLIARGLLEVDVAPFDSLDAFSEALTRHERGPRHEVVRRLLKRAEPACAGACVVGGDRRRSRATATDLRRALRAADARLYEQQVTVTAWTTMPPPPPSRARTAPAIAACIGSGLLLIATGEFMFSRGATAFHDPAIVPPAPPAYVNAMPAEVPAIRVKLNEPVPRPRAPAPRRTAAVQRTSRAPESPRPVPRVWPEPRERPPAAIRKADEQRSGVMDRLRLRWLRDAFVTRSETF